MNDLNKTRGVIDINKIRGVPISTIISTEYVIDVGNGNYIIRNEFSIKDSEGCTFLCQDEEDLRIKRYCIRENWFQKDKEKQKETTL